MSGGKCDRCGKNASFRYLDGEYCKKCYIIVAKQNEKELNSKNV